MEMRDFLTQSKKALRYLSLRRKWAPFSRGALAKYSLYRAFD